MTPIIIAAAVLAVIVLRRVNRVIGSFFAILLAVGVGVWGLVIYRTGGGLAFAGMRLPRSVFFGIVVLWLVLEALALWQTLARRKREASAGDGAAPEDIQHDQP